MSASVTDFADSLGYCEYKIPLSIKGTRPVPSAALIQGSIAHHEKEQYEQEHAQLEPVTVAQIKDKQTDIEFAREHVRSTLDAEFEFPSVSVRIRLSGRIDKILREDAALVIQDDKFTQNPQAYDVKTQPYPGQLLQVLAYLNSSYSTPAGALEMPHSEKKWQIRICDAGTRLPHKTFSGYQDDYTRQYLYDSLQRFAQVALEITQPRHHNNARKCNACNLKSSCDFRIT